MMGYVEEQGISWITEHNDLIYNTYYCAQWQHCSSYN